mmetsp:Transcript_3997/g.6094  ORF Transcript_3997/g.6094 Transcript_3997/m.6094 type:complete len:88 (+) Transcript_3997:609-872(+)
MICQESNFGSTSLDLKASAIVDKNAGKDPPLKAIENTPRSLMASAQMSTIALFNAFGTSALDAAVVKRALNIAPENNKENKQLLNTT